MDNTTKWYNSKYDSYGNLINEIRDEIKPGDLVEYCYACTDIVTKKNIKIKIQGIWDGSKVKFNDKKKTVVKCKEWLTLVK